MARRIKRWTTYNAEDQTVAAEGATLAALLSNYQTQYNAAFQGCTVITVKGLLQVRQTNLTGAAAKIICGIFVDHNQLVASDILTPHTYAYHWMWRAGFEVVAAGGDSTAEVNMVPMAIEIPIDTRTMRKLDHRDQLWFYITNVHANDGQISWYISTHTMLALP